MSHTLAPWQPAFLAALREVPVVQHACDAAGIQRSTAYRARQGDKDFAEAWDDAMESGVDKAEREAWRRSVEGYTEPVIHQGRLIYAYERFETTDDDGVVSEHFRPILDTNGQPVPLTVRKHSDGLLSMILKGRRKQVYADRTEITGAEGGPLAVDETTRQARLQAILQQARERRAAEDFS